MPDLEMLLRDVRPVPDPDWAARLDKRAAAGFPGPALAPQEGAAQLFATTSPRASLATATAATLLVIVVVGIKLQQSAGSSDDSAGGASGSAPAAMSESSKRAGGGSSSDSAASTAAPLATPGSAPAGGDRAVLKNAAAHALGRAPARSRRCPTARSASSTRSAATSRARASTARARARPPR